MPEVHHTHTYTATIYVGVQEGYDGPTHMPLEAIGICKDYCDEVGYAVTVTPTYFVYKSGQEPGVAVGLINYPRFPVSDNATTQHALELAKRLKEAFNQKRVSIVFPDQTIMLGER